MLHQSITWHRSFYILVGVLLVTSVFPGRADASHGNCVDGDYHHRGAYRIVSTYGVGATVEWDQPPTPCANNDQSVAWPMAGGNDSYIQGGWIKSNGYDTEIFFEWKRPGEAFGRRRFGFDATYTLRFVVERNEALGSTTWSLITVRPSDGARATAYSVSNIPTPMANMKVYGETSETGQRMWGRPGDTALYSDFRYDAGPNAGGWRDTTLTCAGEPDPHHFQLSCSQGTSVSSFTTWDDRR